MIVLIASSRGYETSHGSKLSRIGGEAASVSFGLSWTNHQCLVVDTRLYLASSASGHHTVHEKKLRQISISTPDR